MQTTTMKLTHEALAALVNLIDSGVKASGIRMVKPAALVMPLLEAAQTSLKGQDNSVELDDGFDETTEVTIDG